MTASQDLLVLYRAATSRYHAAVTTFVESGDTCTLLVLGDGSDWEDGVPAAFYARPMASIPKGTGVGQWSPVPATDEVTAAITSAVSGGLTGYATTGYVDSSVASATSGLASSSSVTSAISAAVSGLPTSYSVASAIASAVAGLASSSAVTSAIATALSTAESYADSAVSTAIAAIPGDDDSGLQAVPGSPSTISLALSTSRNPSSARSDSRPTRVTVSGGWSWTLSALGSPTGTLIFKVGNSSTPTTAVVSIPFARGLTVGLSVGESGTLPYAFSYEVAAGDYYEVVTSVTGSGAFGTPLIIEQAI